MFKSINLTTRDQKFSGEDSCLILDFLTQVGEEFDTLGLSEGQIIVWIPNLITKNDLQPFCSASNHSRSGG